MERFGNKMKKLKYLLCRRIFLLEIDETTFHSLSCNGDEGLYRANFEQREEEFHRLYGDVYSWLNYSNEWPIDCKIESSTDYYTNETIISVKPYEPLQMGKYYAVMLGNNVPVGESIFHQKIRLILVLIAVIWMFLNRQLLKTCE
jgi:hypothetical protein